MIICRKCGLELEETMLYCPLCRTSVNMEDEEKRTKYIISTGNANRGKRTKTARPQPVFSF